MMLLLLLLNKVDQIYDINAHLNSMFDVIAVSETWLTNDNQADISLEGFTFCGKNRANKLGGGVGLFIKNEIEFKIRVDIVCDNNINFDIFGVEIVNRHGKNILVIVCYRPPNTDIGVHAVYPPIFPIRYH